MTPNPDIFHAHLDKCAQCREHPFDLCKEGAGLLREAALGLPIRQASKPFNFSDALRWERGRPRPQNIPIRTELGKEIREAFTEPSRDVVVGVDYAEVERRVMASMSATDGKYICAECGCETNTSMMKPCVGCGSVKVVLLSMVEQLFGKNWRECFK